MRHSALAVLRIVRLVGLAALAAAAVQLAAVGTVAAAQSGGSAASSLTLVLPYVPDPHLPGAVVRTPEAMETWIAQDMAEREGADITLTQHDFAGASTALRQGQADIALLPLADPALAREPGLVVIPTKYRTGAMAIMRTDTDIRSWQDLRGRTVCVARGGHYVGTLSVRYGAIEQVYPAAADALIKVREGACDAAVSDDRMLEELLRMPEWKKFSARLPARETVPLVMLAASDNPAAVRAARELARQWSGRGRMSELLKKKTYDIAFEVYLDQEAADCH